MPILIIWIFLLIYVLCVYVCVCVWVSDWHDQPETNWIDHNRMIIFIYNVRIVVIEFEMKQQQQKNILFFKVDINHLLLFSNMCVCMCQPLTLVYCDNLLDVNVITMSLCYYVVPFCTSLFVFPSCHCLCVCVLTVTKDLWPGHVMVI